MKKMKILHIYDKNGIGGVKTVIDGVYSTSIKNPEMLFYCLRNLEDKQSDENNYFYYNSKLKLNFLSFLKLIEIIRSNNISIIHSHQNKSMIYSIMYKLFFNPQLRIIQHEHGAVFQEKKYYGILLKLFWKKINLFIAVSKSIKTKLIEDMKIPDDRIKVLRNFVVLEKFNREVLKGYDRNKQRGKIEIEKNDFILGFVGRLNKVKGCECLVNAIQYITIPNFKVVIAGDGVERKNLERLCKKLNLQDKLIFLGYAEPLEVYSMIDCLAAPSESEASPMIFYETQAVGIPIIASNIVAFNELIKNGENGLLFEQGDGRDLAKKVELLYDDEKLRRDLIENGLENAKKYSLHDYLIKLRGIYEEL
ncbi:MAG: glycosyltransferase family 4 protein [Deltaproteobacteria bacterium]|nr:glycosyltransferase family 4 protein [Deltaproteobacteria bacterium]